MVQRRLRAALLFLLGLVAIGLTGSARAQDYPTRPVTIFVPLAPGTGMDVIVRLYADGLSKSLGKPFVVENRPGAFQMLAVNAVLPVPPDGYSLVAMTSAGASINASMMKNLSYDTNRDFVPLSLYVKSPFILVVDPKLPIHSVRELV